MDVVITYVDGLDPMWQKDYEQATKVPAMQKRYRDWGTLKYLLRGIETNMPFVQHVYLVVSRLSQVPDWVNTEQLKIVLHKDIIPEDYLPTFNSTAIEMFLHRIPGLSEQFLYFNDDMFPVMPCNESDFFENDKIVLGFSKHVLPIGMYKKQCRNSDIMARKALGKSVSCFFVRPQHICSPMLRSQSEELYRRMEQQILSTLSTLRENKNVNQYVFLDYLYYQRRVVVRKISKKHFSVALASADKMKAFLKEPNKKMVCINDVHLKEATFEEMKNKVLDAFDGLLPDKSKFEL